MAQFATSLRTPRFRLSFPELFEPKKVNDNDKSAKYSATYLFPPETDLSEMYDAVALVCEKAFNKELAQLARDANFQGFVKGVKMPFLDAGSYTNSEGGRVEGYEDGWVFIRVNREEDKGAPPVLSRRKGEDGKFIRLSSELDVYAGCWCHSKVSCFDWKSSTGKGISFGLTSIQKLADGVPFGNSSNPEEDYADVEEETDDELAESYDDEEVDALLG